MQGWNNILTLATGDMKFGTNLKVNAQPQGRRDLQHPLIQGSPSKIVHPDDSSGSLKNVQKNEFSPGIVQKGGTKMVHPSKIENSLSGFEEYVVTGVIVSVVTR